MTDSSNLILQALFLAGFCALIIDGFIDPREVSMHHALFMETPLAEEAAYNKAINYHIEMVNADSEGFIIGYFQALRLNSPSSKQALSLLRAIDKVIKADGKVTSKESRFLKLSMTQLGISSQEFKESLSKDKALNKEDENWGPTHKKTTEEETNQTKNDSVSGFAKSLSLPKLNLIKE